MKKAVTNDHTLSDVQKRQIRRDKKQMNGCQGPWQGEMGASLWNDENVLELDSGDCSTPCECSKKHCIVDFKIDSVANFMLYVFHCKKKEKWKEAVTLGCRPVLGHPDPTCLLPLCALGASATHPHPGPGVHSLLHGRENSAFALSLLCPPPPWRILPWAVQLTG